ncbi:MAG TPA: histidinol dehydrogenase [Thermoleophilaceae bacterium]|jgi:histidinol dehydrogenase|nr:histidinol dehydrogenase [Thermoleophilaceae bacterium]
MRIERLSSPSAAQVRALWPPAPNVEADVRAIVDQVRAGGDAAVRELAERFDPAGVAPDRLAVPAQEIEGALGWAEPALLDSLRVAIANVKAVAEAQVGHGAIVELGDGQYIDIAEVPVRRVGAYVPAGRAPYPSTVIMCAITARAAGVQEIAICSPPSVADARVHPLILAACALCGVNEIYRVGGAQAIAALAYGTESIKPVDVIVGPGSPYVQEAKRQVSGVVGIDSIAGPSELVVVAADDADPQLISLDLMAQAEHGPDSAVAVISPDAALLDSISDAVARLAPQRPSVTDALLAVIHTRDAASAVALADALAPEHLELIGDEAEDLVDRVARAGCVFVGEMGATAFGDYVAGSNHVLPTGGAAHFASALSPRTFRRRMARVSLTDEAAGRLAPHGAAIARAEGFPVHGESMERRRA